MRITQLLRAFALVLMLGLGLVSGCTMRKSGGPLSFLSLDQLAKSNPTPRVISPKQGAAISENIDIEIEPIARNPR